MYIFFPKKMLENGIFIKNIKTIFNSMGHAYYYYFCKIYVICYNIRQGYIKLIVLFPGKTWLKLKEFRV